VECRGNERKKEEEGGIATPEQLCKKCYENEASLYSHGKNYVPTVRVGNGPNLKKKE
jgi:hypothetical protein